MLPNKRLNIYPKTQENLNALLSFYFDEYDLPRKNEVQDLMDKTSLSLNQIEFIVRKLAEAYKPLFKDVFKTYATASGLLMYGIEALTIDETNWKGSKARIEKTKEFLQFVQNTEKEI